MQKKAMLPIIIILDMFKSRLLCLPKHKTACRLYTFKINFNSRNALHSSKILCDIMCIEMSAF